MENVGQLVSRKERRKLEEKRRWSRQMKKGTAIVGTTLTACSLVAPLAQPVEAEAAVAGQSSRATNTSAFIAEIAAHAQPVAQKNDLYASVMIAQAIVESGWGQSTLARAPYYNLFGIKGSYQGQSVYMDTQEYLNGKWVTMKEPFRDYPSFQQSFEDNASVLRNVKIGGQYYYRGAWKRNCSSYRDATAWLTGRYATAPHYATALNNVIESYNLTRFDTPASGSAGGGASTGSSNNNTGNNNSSGSSSSSSTTTNSYYTVKAGDSVWLIANNHGITMAQLVEWNGIKNNLIHPGQKMIVKKGRGSSSSSSTGSTTKPSTSTNNNTGSSSGTNTTGNTYYTVRSGDSVWFIANKYGISMDQLVQWNGIKDNFIYPGQKVIVKKGSGSAATTGNTGSNASTTKSYKVVSGDSLWAISEKYGMTINQLKELNNLKSDMIYVGQTLKVK